MNKSCLLVIFTKNPEKGEVKTRLARGVGEEKAPERCDAVIGPATDGGFYLIGLNRVLPELFLDRQWSTPEVFGETTTILQRFAIEYERLPELSDIDTFDDLKKSTLWPLQP
jgi:glycosyltransferase A (GT-A) superfamily protein (DUF2064 family)